MIFYIKDLNKKVRQKIESIRSPYTYKIIDFIFKKPIFYPTELSKEIKTNRVTVLRLVRKLQEIGVVSSHILHNKKRKVYIFKELIDILK